MSKEIKRIICELEQLHDELINEIGLSLSNTKEAKDVKRTFSLLIDQIHTLPSFDSVLI